MSLRNHRRRISLSAPPATPSSLDRNRGRSVGYYLVEVLLILPLQFLIIYSAIYIPYTLFCAFQGVDPWTRNLFMDIYAPLEMLFYGWMAHHHRYIQPIALPPAHFTPSFAKQLFIRILGDFKAADTRNISAWDEDTSMGAFAAPALRRDDRRSSHDVSMLADHIPPLQYTDPKAIDFREKVRTWFNMAEWAHITHDDILTWLSWSLLGLPLSEVGDMPFLEECLGLVEKRTGSCFPRERPSGAPPPTVIRLTIDPVKTRHRPLALYLLLYAAHWFTRTLLVWCYGASVWTTQGERGQGEVEYIIRVPHHSKKADDAPPPITLMHGLGFGLPHYGLTFTFLMNSFPDRAIIMPLNPSTSMMAFSARYLQPITRAESSRGLSEVLGRLNADCTDIVSHSFGTIAHTHILKDAPELIRKSVFLDPVTFCLWEGDLCYRFLYKIPRNALELLMSYFIATETGLANTLQRSFSWSCNLLWPQEFDAQRTKVFLGGDDAVFDSKRVYSYLKRHGMQDGHSLHFMDGFKHGECLIKANGTFDIVCDFFRGG